MSLLRDTPLAGADRQREAERAFDSLVLKQLIQASGAFAGKSGAAGGTLFSDLIVDALADSLAAAGRPEHGPANPLLSVLPSEAVSSAGRSGVGAGDTGFEPSGVALRPAGFRSAPNAGRATAGLPPSNTGVTNRLDPRALVEGGAAITSRYGVRTDPFGAGEKHHHGVDLGAAAGSEVVAAADGVVRRAGDRGAYGQAVEVDHGGGVTTLYAHASELLVTEGQTVRKGQPIARVGDTGRATGPHLHFELRVRDRPVDPVRALKAYGQRAD